MPPALAVSSQKSPFCQCPHARPTGRTVATLPPPRFARPRLEKSEKFTAQVGCGNVARQGQSRPASRDWGQRFSGVPGGQSLREGVPGGQGLRGCLKKAQTLPVGPENEPATSFASASSASSRPGVSAFHQPMVEDTAGTRGKGTRGQSLCGAFPKPFFTFHVIAMPCRCRCCACFIRSRGRTRGWLGDWLMRGLPLVTSGNSPRPVSTAAVRFLQRPDADPHLRWCGRAARKGRPYPIRRTVGVRHG